MRLQPGDVISKNLDYNTVVALNRPQDFAKKAPAAGTRDMVDFVLRKYVSRAEYENRDTVFKKVLGRAEDSRRLLEQLMTGKKQDRTRIKEYLLARVDMGANGGVNHYADGLARAKTPEDFERLASQAEEDFIKTLAIPDELQRFDSAA